MMSAVRGAETVHDHVPPALLARHLPVRRPKDRKKAIPDHAVRRRRGHVHGAERAGREDRGEPVQAVHADQRVLPAAEVLRQGARRPRGLDFLGFLQTLDGMFDKERSAARRTERTRTRRCSWPACTSWTGTTTSSSACGAASSTTRRPAGRIIPFCAYNGGLTHRTAIENQFSIPMDEYRHRRKERGQGEDSLIACPPSKVVRVMPARAGVQPVSRPWTVRRR